MQVNTQAYKIQPVKLTFKIARMVALTITATVK